MAASDTTGAAHFVFNLLVCIVTLAELGSASGYF